MKKQPLIRSVDIRNNRSVLSLFSESVFDVIGIPLEVEKA